MAGVITLTGMSRSAGRKCRDLGPRHHRKRTSDAEWLTCLLLVAACQRDPSLPLSVPYGLLSCDDI